MRRFGLSEGTWRAILARTLTPILATCLLFAALDLHSLLHQGPGLTAGAGHHDQHHPEPARLDHGSVDVPCLACLFGLKSQSRPAEAPGAITRPAAHSPLAVVTISSGVADLSYRLPLSRAPPLS